MNNNDNNDSSGSMKISEMILKIWENQEETKKDISAIKVTLAEQNIILDEHQRRSIANEEAVKLLSDRFTPIEKHVIVVNTIVKLGVAVGGIIGVIGVLFQIISFLIK